MKQIILNPLLVLLITGQILTGQVFSFSKFPLDNQIYQRDLSLNKGIIMVSGRVSAPSAFDEIELKVFRENTFQQSIQSGLVLNQNTADFALTFFLPVCRCNHRIEFWAHSATTKEWILIKTAQNVVVGDIFIINGQSNAQALASPAPEDITSFTRSYAEPHQWGPLNLSFPGLWGARLSKRISEYANIPVAIFNQAVGALPIHTYLRSDNTLFTGNYEDLMERLRVSGTEHHVRAAFWFHGEADGWGTSTEDYKKNLRLLFEEWREDYQTEHTFLFQKRYQSCTSPFPYVMEAQRQVAENTADISIMSTTNARHDSCHFHYLGGYQALGDRMFELVAQKLYGADFTETAAPDIMASWLETPVQVVIKVKNTNSLQQIGWPWLDFRTEGEKMPITGGSVEGNLIRLNLAGPATGITGVSYLPHPGEAPHWITNTKGVGLLGFYNAPVGNRPVTDAPEAGDNVTLKVWPNPVSDIVWLHLLSGESNVIRAAIFDISGKIVEQFNSPTNFQSGAMFSIPTNALRPGIYILALETDVGKIFRTKLIVARDGQ